LIALSFSIFILKKRC